jgi:hypothetical protein
MTTGTSSATERDVPIVPDKRVVYKTTGAGTGSTYVVEIDEHPKASDK